ncbi:spore germination protein [Fredinandcohnia sp. QZ13]|uniref:spore germination protein n=1 Tax=Fredinandcohnia sp. QZ13 TaxID=3073144 RepID=UPI002853604E|nr:spore germination protein [Fredinandcohnia sp. QZ13]MDR4886247.1 spore germination protein [Fredinandcohnia sp. QZ13]
MFNLIKIGNFKVNAMTQNSNINFGGTVQNSHTANIKLYGASFSMGDFSPTSSLNISKVNDSDISDQGQIENPSAPEENN